MNVSIFTSLFDNSHCAPQEIINNPWFQGLLTDYHKALLAEKISPPWLPDIDDELDASYFGSHEEEEKTFSSKKDILDKKTQRLFHGFQVKCDE